MSDMLKITAMDTAKNYATSSKPLAQSSAVFDLVDLSKVVKTNDKTQDFRQTNNSFESDGNAVLNTELKITKDSSFMSRMLKSILGSDTISSEQIPDAASKEFNEFVKNIFLDTASLKGDIIAQEKGITSFQGDLFNMLRQILENTQSPEMKNAISSFLRNFSTLSSQNEILGSISSNLKYLSEIMSPSKSISNSLLDLSNLFSKDNAGINFPALKQQALQILEQAGNSLIATDKITSMISLIKYNLSRFSDNPNLLTQSFNSILSNMTSESMKQKFTDAFEKFIEGSSIPYPTKDALLEGNNNYINSDKLTHEIALSLTNRKIPDAEALNNSDIIKLIKQLGENDTLNVTEGTSKIRQLLEMIIPSDKSHQLNQILSSFEQTKDLNSLINRIRCIINSVSDIGSKELLAENLNKILTSLSNSSEVIYQKPTTLATLVDFMAKSLGNENIKYLGMVDPNTLIQNMLTAPGVFTPLMHYVLPVQIEDLRAFGELWVDKDADDSSGGEGKDNHMFLSFDIENVGLFELEITNHNKDLNVSLFCPKEFVKPLSVIKSSIQNIAFSKGYKISNTKIDALIVPRTLTQVFPEIAERRSGLNVKI